MGEGEEMRESQRVTSRRRDLEGIIYVQRLHLVASLHCQVIPTKSLILDPQKFLCARHVQIKGFRWR